MFQICQITRQKKEEIALFLDQKNFFNPADLLSKFDLRLDTVQDWVSKTQQVFAPQWLQRHPKEYMQQLFEQSQQAIEAQAQGGYQPDKVDLTIPSVEINNVCCNFILASDPVTDVKGKLNQPQYKILVTLFRKYR